MLNATTFLRPGDEPRVIVLVLGGNDVRFEAKKYPWGNFRPEDLYKSLLDDFKEIFEIVMTTSRTHLTVAGILPDPENLFLGMLL